MDYTIQNLSNIILVVVMLAIAVFVGYQWTGAAREQQKQHKPEPPIEIYMPPEAMWHCDDCGKEGIISADCTTSEAIAVHCTVSPGCKAENFWKVKR